MIRLTLAQIAQITGGTVLSSSTVGSMEISAPVVIDSRKVQAGGLFAAFVGEHVDGHQFAEAVAAQGAAILASRSVDVPGVLVDDVTDALTKLATQVLQRLRRDGQLRVIGITGSQGKTSVKDLTAHALSNHASTVASVGSFNNELGVPLTVLEATDSTRFLVLEMGARGRGHIEHLCKIAPPDIAAVLNVGSAHVGEFGSKSETALAKGELISAVRPTGIAVLNQDDPLVLSMSANTVAKIRTFGRAPDPRATDALCQAGQQAQLNAQLPDTPQVAFSAPTLDQAGHPTFRLTIDSQEFDVTVPQIGLHHAVNAAAAASIATAAGVPAADVITSLSTAVSASPMRMQRFERSDGVLVINDAYNANPESMAAALRTVAAFGPRRTIAVLGQMLELGEHHEQEHRRIGQLANELGFESVIVVGADASAIAQGAGSISELVDDVDAAVRTLSRSLHAGDVVLVKASRGARLERIVHGLLDN